MVKNNSNPSSKETYGDLVTRAMKMTDNQEVGETLHYGLGPHIEKMVFEAIDGNYKKKVTGKYFIWVLISKDPYANNAMKIFPMCRRTPPSPYFTEDHFCWSYDADANHLQYEWNIPRKEITGYVLNNPNMFDPSWVRMLKLYKKGELLPCHNWTEQMEQKLENEYQQRVKEGKEFKLTAPIPKIEKVENIEKQVNFESLILEP